MADPHIQSPMDFWDKLTVTIYRSGFLVAAVGTAFFFPKLTALAVDLPYITLLVAATLCASSLHIYMKNFRLILQFATWLALLCHVLDWQPLALGGALLTLGGLAFKEYFCFRIFGLNLMPIFVSGLWLGAVADMPVLRYLFSPICALLFLILFIQKCKMPLHFDIGDKSKYQI